MDNTTTPTTTSTATAEPVTPFPASDGPNAAARPADSGNEMPASASQANGGAGDAAPGIDRLVKRAASSAHNAIDSIASKVSSLTDGLQGGVSKAGDARDEWIEAARDAVREHPLATVAGAMVVGAALLSLLSSRRD